ncbi:MAG: sugar transporter, partial [Flavobacteriaceae bacterium]|nr:sugar transporter [Flavobacteriaceae bacterium]
MDTWITIKDEQNPFFTSNTSLVFNWGGTTDKVQTMMTTIKSRTHNEKVVDKLNYFVNYTKEAKYYKQDIYKQTPFYVEIEKSNPQLLGNELGIKFLDNNRFELRANFESSLVTAQNYQTKEIVKIPVGIGEFKQTFSAEEFVDLPFVSFTLRASGNKLPVGEEYLISFSNFDAVVNQYKNIQIEPENK